MDATAAEADRATPLFDHLDAVSAASGKLSSPKAAKLMQRTADKLADEARSDRAQIVLYARQGLDPITAVRTSLPSPKQVSMTEDEHTAACKRLVAAGWLIPLDVSISRRKTKTLYALGLGDPF